MANRAIEFHDGFLETITVNDGHAVLTFSSICIHESVGKARPRSWVRLVPKGSSSSKRSFGMGRCQLSTGILQLGRECHDNCVAIPIDYAGSVAVELQEITSQFGPLKMTGTRVWLELIGDACYVEEFPAMSSWKDRESLRARDRNSPVRVIRHYRPTK